MNYQSILQQLLQRQQAQAQNTTVVKEQYIPLQGQKRNNNISEKQAQITELVKIICNDCEKCNQDKKEENRQLDKKNENLNVMEEEEIQDEKTIKKTNKKKGKKKQTKKKQEQEQEEQQYCLLCDNREKYFISHLYKIIFEIDKMDSNLSDKQQADSIYQQSQKYITYLQSLGNTNKGFCGKILRKNDIGFKCLDCEMDNTCIICQECFEKGDHKGHRIYQQQGCQGCCDCGDIEAWKESGFCCDHKGFVDESNLDLNQIPEQWQNVFQEVYCELFYQFFKMAEDYDIHLIEDYKIKPKKISKINFSHQRLSDILSWILQSLTQIIGQNLLVTAFIREMLINTFQQNLKNSNNKQFLLQHECQNLQKNNYDLESQGFECKCTILENIFRFNFSVSKEIQKQISEFFITTMFSLYKFKQDCIVTYTKMINFLLLEKIIKVKDYKQLEEHEDLINMNLDKEKQSDDIRNYIVTSKIMDTDVQLFTSDELAIKAIQGNHYYQIHELSIKLLKIGTLTQFSKVPNKNFDYSSFWRIFNHLKYSGMKAGSMIHFLKKEGMFQQMTNIIRYLQYGAKYELQYTREYDSEELIQKQFQFIDAEALVFNVIEQMVIRIVLDDEIQNKKQILSEWLIIIIQQIEEFDLENKKIDFSFINIPLHRTFSLVLFAYFDLNLNNFQNQNVLDELVKSLNLSTLQFLKFLNKQLLIPLQNYSFSKEIEKGIWVYSGENMKLLPQIYFRGKLGFFSLDMLFIQQSLLIMQIYQNQIEKGQLQENKNEILQITGQIFQHMIQNFTMKTYWQNIVQNKIEISKMTTQKFNQFEKYLFLISDFFSLLCFLQVDVVSPYNVIMNLFKEDETKDELLEQYADKLKPILVSFLQQYKQIDILSIKKQLANQNSFLATKRNIDKTTAKICNFDKQKKQFSLKSQYQEKYVEQYLFFPDSKLFSAYTDVLHNKYQQDENCHNITLGIRSSSFKRENFHENITQILLYEDTFIKFLSKISISQILKPNLGRENEQNQYVNPFLSPLLKLLNYFILQYLPEDEDKEFVDVMKNENQEYQKLQFNLETFNKLDKFLVKLCLLAQNVSQENKNTIVYLQNVCRKLIKDNQQQNKELQQQMSQINTQSQFQDELDTHDSVFTQQSSRLSTKEANKSRQQKLMNKFKMKSQKFQELNENIMSSQISRTSTEGEEDDNDDIEFCVICKENLYNNYGMCAYISKSNILKYSKFQSHMKNFLNEQNIPLNTYLNQFSDINSDLWNISEGTFNFQSCQHLIHTECYQQYIKDKKRQNQSKEYEYQCPLCNRFSNIFINIIGQKGQLIYKQNTIIKSQEDKENQIEQEESYEIIQKKIKQQKDEQSINLQEQSQNQSQFQTSEFTQSTGLSLSTQEDNQLGLTLETHNFQGDDEEEQKKQEIPSFNQNYQTDEEENLIKKKNILSNQYIQNHQFDIVNYKLLEGNLQKIPDYIKNTIDNLMGYLNPQTLKNSKNKEDKEFDDIQVSYDKFQLKQENNSIQTNKYMVDNIEFFVNTVQAITITEYENEDEFYFDNENQILDFFESALKIQIMEIDLNGINSFIKNQMPIYQNIFGIYKIFFSQFTSKTKGVFIKDRLHQLLNTIAMVGSCQTEILQKLVILSQNIDKEESILLSDLDDVLIDFVLYIKIYFSDIEQKIPNLMENILYFFIFAKLKQIQVIENFKNNENKQFQQQSLIAMLKQDQYIKLVLPLLRKFLGVYLITSVTKQKVLNHLNQVQIDYLSEFNVIIFTLGLKFENFNNYYQQNSDKLNKMDVNICSQIQKNNQNLQKMVSANYELSFNFLNLENKFGDLHKQFLGQKCEVCNDFPKYQELCLCLICGATMCSVTCENTFQNNIIGTLNNHSLQKHCGASVFMSLKNSQVYLIKTPRNTIDDPLFVDQYGQPFKMNSKDWNSFYLDIDMFNNLKKIVVTNSLTQDIQNKCIKHEKYYKESVF